MSIELEKMYNILESRHDIAELIKKKKKNDPDNNTVVPESRYKQSTCRLFRKSHQQ